MENEVEHDTRIRRSYKNVRGQHNVPCWQWVGPSSTGFDDVGVSIISNLLSGRLILVRWLMPLKVGCKVRVVGPRYICDLSMSFDLRLFAPRTRQRLDPGRAPRLWLLRWLNEAK